MTALPDLKKIDKSTRPVKARRPGTLVDLSQYFDLSGQELLHYFLNIY